MTAAQRDDDPAHPNFDGIVFYATTDRSGIVTTAQTGQRAPPMTFLPITVAAAVAVDIAGLIATIRTHDPASYLATYLDTMLDDFTAAIEVCRPQELTP